MASWRWSIWRLVLLAFFAIGGAALDRYLLAELRRDGRFAPGAGVIQRVARNMIESASIASRTRPSTHPDSGLLAVAIRRLTSTRERCLNVTMANKVDVSVSLNEVLAKLTKDGTLRKALLELAEEEGKGSAGWQHPVGGVRPSRSDKDLQAVTGGERRDLYRLYGPEESDRGIGRVGVGRCRHSVVSGCRASRAVSFVASLLLGKVRRKRRGLSRP